MEVKPIHILAASAVAFLAIVGANLIVSYRSNENFRDKLTSLGSTKLGAIRDQRIAEEMMVPAEVAEDE